MKVRYLNPNGTIRHPKLFYRGGRTELVVEEVRGGTAYDDAIWYVVKFDTNGSPYMNPQHTANHPWPRAPHHDQNRPFRIPVPKMAQ